ncbi:MAG: DNA-binding response regulator [Myxococcales bacterium]|nr:DNA-binding response regulator [Myxococcales bacterium]
MSETILIVDDEADLRKLLDFNLTAAGFRTVQAATGQEALSRVREETPDLIILDLMLPDMRGTEICRSVKRDPATRHVPVLMLSALGEEIDRVVGFELGAEDYVVKPFSVRELVLRVKAILKRISTSSPVEEADELSFGPIRIDRTRHRAWIGEDELKLTALEFKLLSTFVARRGAVQSRERLLEEVWGVDAGVTTTRTVDTHVKRLREKLGPTARFLETVRGVGYRFAESPTHD